MGKTACRQELWFFNSMPIIDLSNNIMFIFVFNINNNKKKVAVF